MPETEDLYEILHLHPSAHPDVIQAAYRRLALLYHPDRNPSPDASEMMAAVNRAYEVLSDPEKRAEYDRSRAAQSGPSNARESGRSPSQHGPQGGANNWQLLNNDQNNVGIYTTALAGSDCGLIVRFKDGELQLFVSWMTEVSYSEITLVSHQIDNGSFQSNWWDVSTNYRATFMSEGDVFETIMKLLDATYFTVLLTPSTGDSIVATFEVGGFRDAYRPVHEAFLRQRSDDHSEGGADNYRGRSSSPSGSRQWDIIQDGQNIVIITNDPVDNDYSLRVAYFDHNLILNIYWSTTISFGTSITMNWQVDEGPLRTGPWVVSSDGKRTYMPLAEVPHTIHELFTANQFKAWVTPNYSRTELFALFKIDQFPMAFGAIYSAMQSDS